MINGNRYMGIRGRGFNMHTSGVMIHTQIQKGDALEIFLVLHLNWLFVGKRTDLQPNPVVKYFLDIVA